MKSFVLDLSWTKSTLKAIATNFVPTDNLFHQSNKIDEGYST